MIVSIKYLYPESSGCYEYAQPFIRLAEMRSIFTTELLVHVRTRYGGADRYEWHFYTNYLKEDTFVPTLSRPKLDRTFKRTVTRLGTHFGRC